MKTDAVPNTITNVKEFIYGSYQLRRNEVTGELELDTKPIRDIDINSIVIDCKERYQKITSQTIGEILYSKATPTYNPFKEFFANAPKAPSTGELMKLVQSIETDTPFAGLWIEKWLLGLVRSAYEGQHSPLYLALVGGQNTGKTEWFRRLLPSELSPYYSECKFTHGKDDEILMTRKLIILDDEMSGKSKAEEAQLKNRTSIQSVTVRLPYGKVDTKLNRIAMLCGTSNPTEILSDPTGNRRILPINVKRIDHNLYNSVDKKALLYELYYMYQLGKSPDLDSEEIKLLNTNTAQHEVTCPVEETISRFYTIPNSSDIQKAKKLTATEIMNVVNSHLLGYKVSTIKVGQTLKKLGFIQSISRVGSCTSRLYNVLELKPYG